MSKDPAVLFYTSDFLTGTAFFTDAQRGQYIRLLCEQHQIGHIPPEHMLEICKTADSPVIKKFTTDENGFFFNTRMEEEIEKRRQFSEYQSKKAKKRWEDREPSDAPALPRHMPEGMPEACIRIENENININDSVITDKGESAERGKRQEPEKPKIKKTDFIDRIIEQFVEASGGEYEIVNRGKEREATGKLLHIYKQRHPESDSEATIKDLRAYFERCLKIEDPWLREWMSIPIIISKFNQINRILKNGKSKGTGVTDAELARLMARKHGIDAPATGR